MKKIEKFKLNQLSKKELEMRQMNFLKGGGCSSGTYCWCPSVPPGGISTSATNSDGWYQLDEQSG